MKQTLNTSPFMQNGEEGDGKIGEPFMEKLKTVDLFSGCGGMTLGFQNAGFNIIAAYDNWIPAVNVYRMNFDHPIYEQDLADESVRASIKEMTPYIIIGGPPCQDFSSAGHRNVNLGRAVLTLKDLKMLVMA